MWSVWAFQVQIGARSRCLALIARFELADQIYEQIDVGRICCKPSSHCCVVSEADRARAFFI